jgi:hypothetical protein
MIEIEKPKPCENELVGTWIEIDGRVVGDQACERIQTLTDKFLIKVGTDRSGWETLFRDPEDGRYWERTYPHGEWHGGGPPTLYYLSDKEATEKYHHLFQ